MSLGFVNRKAELAELDIAARHGGLLVVFGRRRVGKTRLLRQWLQARRGLYSQAIEGPRDLQLQQVFADLRPQLETQLVPKTWPELFEILTLQKQRWVLCLDEFPYLTAVDASLPSQLQKWLDHALPSGCLVIVAGSSTRMMNALFLHRAAPLYGRARKLLHVQPMEYAAFCAACALRPATPESFEKFACVGGIPKYWEFLEPRQDSVALAESLYFDYAPYMEQEPQRILRDEGVSGLNAVAVLEAVGRGAERPSEIASRLGTAQTNLSRLFQQLLDASVLVRELPFGESVRSTKKTLYRIQDPTLRFWFRVFSPHQSRWWTYTAPEKRKLIHDHAATVFEAVCRERFPGARRYWEGDVELDLVAPDPEDPKRLLVAEVKWRRLSVAERKSILEQLQTRWAKCSLSARYPRVRFDVLDARVLGVWFP
ncbi:MAG: ATP-binding protein [Verrucomicrobiae bacterium]|nr:ATP-binding protein [Verrucomicrobiae bacterium]